MQSGRRSIGIVVALAVITGLFISSAIATPAGAQAVFLQTGDTVQQMDESALQTTDQPEPDNTITRIDLAADSSATWTITLRTRLANDTDVTEYEQFQERFRSNTSRYLDPFADRITGVVGAANDSLPRAMNATDFAAETTIQEVPQRWGIVRFRFTWTNFAATEGETLVVGDTFRGGFFIGEGDALVLAVPNDYTIESVSPPPDETAAGVVEWRGREDFANEQPSIRAVPTDGSEGGSDRIDAVSLVVLGVVGLLVVFGGVAYVIRTGRVTLRGTHDATMANNGTDIGSADSNNNGPANADDNVEPPADETATPAASPEDSELLTDEAQVISLLTEHDGRMKQSAIADELEWSKSKTSRVLSGMAEAGDIEKLRIGRENVIDLSENDGEY